jgi:hypothetical protein
VATVITFARCAVLVAASCGAPNTAPRVVAKKPAASFEPSAPPSPDPASPHLASAQPDSPRPPVDLSVLAPKVGAALIAGRVDDARALIGDAVGDCNGTVGAQQRSDGGFVVYGGRITARLDPKGVVEAYRLEPACVDFADEQVTLTHVKKGDDLEFTFHGAIQETTSLADGTFVVESSADWIAVIGYRGDYVAWPRGTSKLIRATADEGEGTVPHVAGRYLVTVAGSALTLHGADGTKVRVRGCKAPLLAAASAPGGVALHVATNPNGADSAVCIVSDRGATRKATPLGHATCGMKTSMPCSWELAVASPAALVFTGMRGGVVVIDSKTGAKLALKEPASQFPGAYARCGDTICVTTTTSDDVTSVGTLERVGRAVRYKRLDPKAPLPADATSTLQSSWCDAGDLLVPCAP